jgi:signal transduction histidine kinase/ligand-binding sensor domain-containing protein
MPHVAWLLAILIALPTASKAQNSSGILRDYTISSWTEREGISGRIFAIAQTPDEYLWLGTDTGLIRFDGVRFVPWTEISDQPLAARRVLTMCVGVDGSLWVGFTSPGGISRIKNGTVINYDKFSGLTGEPVENLSQDRDGSIWASTREGLFRFRDETWERIRPEGGLSEGPVSSTFHDSHGNLWVSTPQGVFRRLRDQETFKQIIPASYWSHRVMEDRNHAMWITAPRVGAVRLLDSPEAHPPAVSKLNHPPGANLPGEQDGLGVQVLPDSRGDIWIATLGAGLRRLRSGGAMNVEDTLTIDKGLRSNVVRTLWEDHKKNIWVGTNAGLHQLSRKTITALTGLGVVRNLERGTDDSIWAGTTTGLLRFKNGRQVRYGSPELPSALVTALHGDRQGTLWIVTNAGVTRFKDERFFPLKIPFAQLTRVYSATTDAQGHLWLCDRNHGLFRWANGTLTPFDVAGLVDHRTVTWVGNDAAERVWFKAAGALYMIDPGGSPRRLDWGDGFSGIYQETSDGPLWLFGVNGAGRLDGEGVSTIGRTNGLPETQVFAVVPTSDGYVWVKTPVGILRVSEEVFRQAKKDPAIKIPYTLYDTEDGMAGLPLGSSAIRGADGRLWFTTLNGIAIVDSNIARGDSTAPPVHIQGLQADAQRLDIASTLRLPPNTATIEVDYSAVTFSSPTKVRYRYRLEGFDRDWQDAGTRREALYTNLPPGQYRFHVSAAHNERGFSSDGATIAFTLLPAFYQTSWFYWMCALTVALALWAIWRLRVRHLQHEFQLVLGERVRVSREIHDTLLQSLAGVALQLDALSESAPVGAMKDALVNARREVEEYVRETRRSIRKLRSPKLEHGDLAMALRHTGERATSGTPVQFTLTTTGQVQECQTDVEQQLLRIGEQAVLNSVRHANASEVHVKLHYGDDAIQMRVSDNGRGFNPEDVMADGSEHYGLVSMRERTAQAGGQMSITTHPGGGTAVEVVVPVALKQ